MDEDGIKTIHQRTPESAAMLANVGRAMVWLHVGGNPARVIRSIGDD
ncbi:hypothetical protein MTR72_00765 [Bradyrhizobium sp. ISRA442]